MQYAYPGTHIEHFEYSSHIAFCSWTISLYIRRHLVALEMFFYLVERTAAVTFEKVQMLHSLFALVESSSRNMNRTAANLKSYPTPHPVLAAATSLHFFTLFLNLIFWSLKHTSAKSKLHA